MAEEKETPVFDMDDMIFPSIMLMVGKPRKGKTHLIRYLVRYFSLEKPVFKFGLCMTGSYYNDDYDYLPNRCIMKGYDPDVLKKYHEKLITLREQTPQDQMPANFIILDDVLGQLNNDGYFQNVISCHRHTNTTIILASQYLASRASSTNIREYTNYAFLFSTKAASALKQYHSWFGTDFDTIEEYKRHFEACTREKHACMLFIEGEDDPLKNYIQFMAPSNAFDNVKLTF